MTLRSHVNEMSGKERSIAETILTGTRSPIFSERELWQVIRAKQKVSGKELLR